MARANLIAVHPTAGQALSFSDTSYNFSYNSIRTLSALYPHLSGQDRRHLYRI